MRLWIKLGDFRIKFQDDKLREKIEKVAISSGVSLNSIINLMLAANFDGTQKKYLQLVFDMIEMNNENLVI
jgi:hypothetical protein